MAIYAANNLFKGIQKYSNSGGALLGGVIANSISNDYQKSIVDDFVGRTETRVMQYIPRSITVTQSELSGRTTIEAAPDSAQAKVYRELAERIDSSENAAVPHPLEPQDLRAWAAKWADLILAIESGEVKDAAQAI
jgi:nitrogenase iron protein NifH